jgi:hypothetical protein
MCHLLECPHGMVAQQHNQVLLAAAAAQKLLPEEVECEEL